MRIISVCMRFALPLTEVAEKLPMQIAANFTVNEKISLFLTFVFKFSTISSKTYTILKL